MMSVIIEDENNNLLLISKGSDDALIPKIGAYCKNSEVY